MRFVKHLATAAASLLVVTTLAGCGEEQARAEVAPAELEPAATTPVADPWDVTPTQPEYEPTPVRLHEPDPVRLDIPAIGVSTDTVALGLHPDGTMQVPQDFAQAGWFTGGPRPGENGPALVAGHVDNESGPAVFYRLPELQAGSDVVVTRTDGSTVTFSVDRIESYEKQAFPTDKVFGPTSDAELRLVTCGGDFDWKKNSYKANVVAYATLRTA